MSDKKSKQPPRPLYKPEVCAVPVLSRKLRLEKPKNLWDATMRFVREQNGRTVKICVHPKARNVVANLKKMYPEFGFVTRTVMADRGPSYGVWAWLVTTGPEPDVPGVPPPPVDPVLQAPAF